MVNNTNDDGEDLNRKLSGSIIFDAQPSGDSIKIKCTVAMNNRQPVVDNVAYRYRGTCMSQHPGFWSVLLSLVDFVEPTIFH